MSDDVDRYLAPLPDAQRRALEHVRAVIASAAPDATQGISYGMPAFKLRGHPLVGYAAWKAHCAIYGMSAATATLAADLEGFETSKGTIRFTTDRPLPDSVIRDLVKLRTAEIDARWPA